MSRFATALGFLMSVVMVAPAFGADAFLAVTGPNVSVNPGLGWKTVQTLQELKAGEQVMADETGHGWIIYCGCDQEILPGKVYTVENRECKVESVNVSQSGLPQSVVPPDGKPGQEEITRCRKAAKAWWVLGGAGVGVGICAAAGCFNGSGGGGGKSLSLKPASP